jgi:CubicO group peptidase (beta-lactamase class C family)
MSALTAQVDPGEVGLDAARLRRLDHFLLQTTSAGRIPGWCASIARHGRLAYVSKGGFRDVDAKVPFEADTLCRIYSMTKPVTAVAAMMLYEQGAFQLSDPVHRFIPSFRDMRVFVGGSESDPLTEPATQPIRMWHLLTHTSGLTYGFHRVHPVDAMYRQAGFEVATPVGVTLPEACDTWAGFPLLFEPGTEWNYSVSMDVLGRVIEVIAGQRLGEFFSEQILDPLGMSDTGFSVPDEPADRLARLYLATPTGAMTGGEALDETLRGLPAAHYGGSGLISTAVDYQRFANMLRGRGALDSVRILSPRTVDFMTRNHLPGGVDLQIIGRTLNPELAVSGLGQGLGMSVVLDPVRMGVLTSPGEFGWGGAASTAFWVDPLLDLTFVFMTQLLPTFAVPIRGLLHQLVQQAVIDE